MEHFAVPYFPQFSSPLFFFIISVFLGIINKQDN